MKTKKFDSLPDHSRIWIYQSPREFSSDELQSIIKKAESFLEIWTSHGAAMDAGIAVLHKRFIIVAVDERTAPPSGCGIDKSVKFIKDISSELNIDLLDRMNVAFRKGDHVESLTLSEFEEAVRSNKISLDVRVFNNLVDQKGRLVTDWEVPASQSWHNRFFS